MIRNQKTGMDDFFNIVREVKKIALVAVGGLVLLPILAGLGGYTPPWPSGIAVITSLAELVILIVVYQLLSHANRSTANRVIACLAIIIFFMSAVYATLNAVFVYQIPNRATRVVLGCGLSEKAIAIISEAAFKPVSVCPGELSTLLASAQYDTDKVWSAHSVSLIKLLLVFSWLMAFGGLAALFGVFASFQRRQNSTS
ncbi:hypothetical protein [Pseudomonas syringae]|uniref:hypothetical protein n=1 Tax=Pseudomonas syringae TaxID=317 RepID=UPI0011126033|nr:hypothetical protein [Pseudomonas syringae]